MLFCKECGSLMIPKKDDKDKKTLICPGCGHKEIPETGYKITETTKKIDKEVEVVEKKIETAPLAEEDCPKCGHKKAYYWLVQTRAGDEAETKFLKCEKCSHSWRDYS